MEEILASIRKIISEDQTEPEKLQPMPVRAMEARAAQADADVLELTEELPGEEPEPEPVRAAPEPDPIPEAPVQPQVQPPIENDVVFENVAPEPQVMDTGDLISDSTRSAVGRSVAKLDAEPAKSANVSAGTLEALFLKAVQEALAPQLREWVDGHRAEIMDDLKPMIRDWMDQNLPRLIEAAVTNEVSRALADRPRGR